MDSREHLYKRYDDLYVVYLNGVYDGKKAAQAEAERGRERNFCERCGKRTADLTVIHTCTPPQVTALAQEQEPVVIKKSSRRYCSQSEQEIDFGN